MIELNLKVSDPTRSDAPKLLALAALFTQLAQGGSADQARAALDEKTTGRVVGASPALAAPYAGQVEASGVTMVLAPADNPERGLPSPAEAFGTTMGNGVAGSVSASSPSLASTGAASTSASPESENGGHSAPAASLPDPAVAFGNGGNVGAVPPPPSGPQTSSAGTPQTLPPPSAAATSASQLAGTPAPMPGTVSAPAATTSNAPGVELDSEGIPWDASIHASTKGKIANGTWKVKRGTPELYLKERKAQLKAAAAVGVAAAAQGNGAPAGVPATPPGNVLPPPAGAGAPAPGSVGNVIPTPQASAQTTPAAAGSSPVVTLAQVMPRVTAAIGAGTLTVDSAAAIVRELSEGKIDNVAMLAVAPALLPAFVARLDALGIPA